MNKIGLFPLILGIIYSCSNPQNSKGISSSLIDMNQVKDSLAKWDQIPVDSIHVVKLKEPGLYIAQGFGRVDNLIRLVKLYPDKFVVLDSIRTFREIDFYNQEKVVYNYKNAWFIYSNIGSGTGALTRTMSLVRVEKKHFSELFTYSKMASFMDVDKIHAFEKWVEIRELEMNRKQLILETKFQSEMGNTSVPSKIEITDTVTFEFSPTRNKFILKKPIDSFLENQFWINKGEYIFRI